jgi:hypothetical protein
VEQISQEVETFVGTSSVFCFVPRIIIFGVSGRVCSASQGGWLQWWTAEHPTAPELTAGIAAATNDAALKRSIPAKCDMIGAWRQSSSTHASVSNDWEV